MKESLIRTEKLTTGYTAGKEVKAITSGLTASLPPASMTCLLGPNGAGKSTLMRTLAGFQKPLAGSVYAGEREISRMSGKERAEMIGVVLTDKPMLENMDVASLVALGRTPYTGFWGRLSKEDNAAIEEAMEMVGIAALRNRDVRSLSDGERQKAMIAKALAQQTPVIFLDEPTAFLDFPSKVDIMRLLSRLAATAGKTVFVSTHDLDIAFQTADFLWLIDRRLGVTTGNVAQLAERGSIEEYFSRSGISFDRENLSFRIER